jgi:hypothetical protein
MALRAIGALAALVSAGVHLYLWFDGYSDLNVVGPAFLLNAVGGVVIAALLLFWRHWIPLFLLFGFGVLTLGAFITSTTVGLFGVHEQWVGWQVWAAAIAEAVAILVAPVAAAREGYLSRRARREVPGRV